MDIENVSGCKCRLKLVKEKLGVIPRNVRLEVFMTMTWHPRSKIGRLRYEFHKGMKKPHSLQMGRYHREICFPGEGWRGQRSRDS